MKVQEAMTPDPVACTPDDPISEAALFMRGNDCGVVPVVESENSKLLVGVLTDRDIMIYVCSEKKNPTELKVEGCMKRSVVTITPDASLAAAAETMGEHKIRRLVVTDAKGYLVGILSLADIARQVGKEGDLDEAALGRLLIRISA